MTTIGIIEDDGLLRDNILTMLSREKDIKVVFACASLEELLNQKEDKKPSIIFVDINLPGISGLEGIRFLTKKYPDAHLVMMTGVNEHEVIWKAILSGAKGYLLKPFKLATLRSHIDLIRNGGTLISPEVAGILANRMRQGTEQGESFKTKYDEVLTDKERGVFHLLLKGYTYKQIAATLTISQTTVNDYLKKIYHKLEVGSKTELLSKCLH